MAGGARLNGTSPVYLDHNATAPLRREAADAMTAAAALCGNPSSVHAFGRAARQVVEEARERVATLASARPADIVFTSGGTEANNLAILGCGRNRILASAIEHPSVLEAADGIETIPVGTGGVVDLDALRSMLERPGPPALVSLMLANNETGVIQPVAEAAALAHERGALMHCDAVQAAGRLPVDFAALGVDLLTLSAHKMGGPKGAGALIVGEYVRLEPIIRGGGQERRRRSGTENLPGIAGFGAAAGLVAPGLAAADELAKLRDALERRVIEEIPAARIVARDSGRLRNTSCLALPGVPAETQVMALDLEGVAVSAGSACSSGKVRPSHVLRAMGLPDEIAACAVRVSLGPENGETDIQRFVNAWKTVAIRADRSAA